MSAAPPAGGAAAHPLWGVALMTGAAACFATMDTLIRYTGPLVGLLLLIWVRYALHAVVMGGVVLRGGRAGFRTAHPRFQVLRGSLLLLSSTLAFIGLQHMPVAEFTAILMLTPVLVTLLAAAWLQQPVTPLRWALVLGCLGGALVVIRPGSGLFGWAALCPLGAALSNAVFQILTHRVGAQDAPTTTNFYTGLTGVALLTPLLLAFGPALPQTLAAMPASHLGLMVAIGLLGTTGHLLLVMSLGQAPAATLMPFLYTQIGFAALAGWAIFGNTPDAWGWLGMGLIAACGAATAWLNLQRAQLRTDPDAMEAD